MTDGTIDDMNSAEQAQDSNSQFSVGAQSDQLQWLAPEFIAHDKTAGWYVIFFGCSVALALIVQLFTRDVIATSVVILAALALGIYAARKPRQVSYVLGRSGFTIGERQYSYHQFRSFWLDEEAGLTTISLLPHKRFGQLISLYFDPQIEESVLNAISSQLPLERRSKDILDRALTKIRF
mgnify:CR=1 FL=1